MKIMKHNHTILKAACAMALAMCTLATPMAGMTGAALAEANVYEQSEQFTERDMSQTADLTEAQTIAVADGQDVHIADAGVYVLTGTATNVTVYVEADSDAKVQLVLDGLNLTNQDAPCVYIQSADKVFVTLSGDSALAVTGSFSEDDNADGVIFSRSDLVLNGTATAAVSSTDNGVVCKDDLKITGGIWNITASSKAIEANDSIRVSDGTLNLNAGTDGLHAQNSDDDALGYIYIIGGTFAIRAGDDAIHAVSVVEIDGGTFDVTAAEGIEGTYIQINGGTIRIQASDDGINAARKSSAYSPTVEINGGDITISMGAGDTDGIDSNGDIVVNGGIISVTGNSTFDYDGSAQYNGGTILVNGQQVSAIPNQMMGGMRGGMQGGMMGGMGGQSQGGMGCMMGGQRQGSMGGWH